MAPSNLQHRRTHNLFLISKLLNQRDAPSPFTLILDSLEQSGKPLLSEFINRAKAANIKVVFVSFSTLSKPKGVDSFIEAWKHDAPTWQKEAATHLKGKESNQPLRRNLASLNLQKLVLSPVAGRLLVFDSLNSLPTNEQANLAGLLSSFGSPMTSILAIYHTDVPVSTTATTSSTTDIYAPSPLKLLKYMATTILATRSIHHVLAEKAARDRSHEEPSFGLHEGTNGIIQGLGANNPDGLVVEMEHRRKSGRAVREAYFLPLAAGKIMLLEDHPLLRPKEDDEATAVEAESTFELRLTEKQKKERGEVVLPYHDAQKGEGSGGRILYDMGSEDDFDEEEDEI